MRILITGINGFTGSYLRSKLIELGFSVVGLNSNLLDYNSLCKEIKMLKPEAVIHLGGVSFAGHKDYKNYYETNLIGTRNLLEVLSEYSKDIKSILIASSGSIYGNHYRHTINENDIPKPANDYAISKLASEYVAKLFMEILPITIVRPFNYTGLGQDNNFLIPKIVEHFNKRKTSIELGNINIQREFNDVRNVVNIYSDLLINIPSGNIFNICTEKTFSIQEIISKCEKITNHKIEIRANSNFCRSNDANRLVGNGQYLREFINPKNAFSMDDTLHWMLS